MTYIFMHAERETFVEGQFGHIVIVQDDESGDEQRIKLSPAQFAKLLAAKDDLIRDANADRRRETQGEAMIFMHAERETLVQGEYGYIVIVQDDENGDEQRIKLSPAQFAKLLAAKDELIRDANSEY